MKRFSLLVVKLVALFVAMGVSMAPMPTQAADLLPGSAIDDDTVAIIWVDAVKLKDDQVAAAMKTIMGDKFKLLETPLKQFAMMKASFVNAGGQGFAIVIRVPQVGNPPDPFFLIKLKDGAEAAGMEAYLRLMVGDRSPIVKVDKGTLLLAERDRHVPQLNEKAGKNHKLFMQKLNKLLADSDAPAGAVFKPNARLRQEMNNGRNELPQMEQFMPGVTPLFLHLDKVVNAEISTLNVKVGEKPVATLNVQTKNEDAAKELVESHTKAGKALVQVIARFKQMQQGRRVGEETIMFGMLKPIFDGKVTADGRTVTLALKTDEFKTVGKSVAAIVQIEQERAKRNALRNQVRQLLIAIRSYAADNGGSAPDKLDDLAKYVGGKDKLAALLKHPITGEAKGVQYFKPPQNFNQIERPHITAMLFEIHKGKIVENGVTGYADGHTEGGYGPVGGVGGAGAVPDQVGPADVNE